MSSFQVSLPCQTVVLLAPDSEEVDVAENMAPLAKRFLQLAGTGRTGGCARVSTIVLSSYMALTFLVAGWQVVAAFREYPRCWLLNILAAVVGVADSAGVLCHWYYARRKRYAKVCELVQVDRGPCDLHVLEVMDWLVLGLLASPIYGFSQKLACFQPMLFRDFRGSFVSSCSGLL